jgi:hypothetical protein
LVGDPAYPASADCILAGPFAAREIMLFRAFNNFMPSERLLLDPPQSLTQV